MKILQQFRNIYIFTNNVEDVPKKKSCLAITQNFLSRLSASSERQRKKARKKYQNQLNAFRTTNRIKYNEE